MRKENKRNERVAKGTEESKAALDAFRKESKEIMDKCSGALVIAILSEEDADPVETALMLFGNSTLLVKACLRAITSDPDLSSTYKLWHLDQMISRLAERLISEETDVDKTEEEKKV